MKFEANKRYEAMSGSAHIFEVIKRTSNRVTYVEVQHAGRYNERKSDPKTARIENWDNGEVFITKNGATIAAF